MKKRKNKTKSVDEWGDEGNWVTLVDLTKIKKVGVPAIDVLKILCSMKNTNLVKWW